jgi:hypothetical protein
MEQFSCLKGMWPKAETIGLSKPKLFELLFCFYLIGSLNVLDAIFAVFLECNPECFHSL